MLGLENSQQNPLLWVPFYVPPIVPPTACGRAPSLLRLFGSGPVAGGLETRIQRSPFFAYLLPSLLPVPSVGAPGNSACAYQADFAFTDGQSRQGGSIEAGHRH